MLLSPIRPWLRSTSFRISMIQAVLLIGAAIGAGTGGWLATRGAAEQEARDRITLEVDAVSREVVTEGLREAIEAVMARAERPGALEYRLVDPAGRVVAGDLAVGDGAQGWRMIDVAGSATGLEGKDRLLLLTRRLPDGSRLTVGDDLGRAEALRAMLLRTLLLWGGMALAIGLAISLFLTRRALKRMEALVRTVHAVADGDLSARAVSPAAPHDDIDQLALGLNRMLDRIDLLVAAVRRVSADVSHDLRTPLSHVRQRLELAVSAPTPEARQAALVAAGEGVEAALKIFDAMLRLAEIDAGGARARFAPIDLAELADRVVDAYRPEVEASGRTLLLSVARPATVTGDADLLAQALANLLENALKHTATSSTIGVFVDGGLAGAVLMVRDDGPGIGPALPEDVLRPFSRLESARTAPGTGLGLPIVQAVARLHRAELVLDDARPGLAVSLRFPGVDGPN